MELFLALSKFLVILIAYSFLCTVWQIKHEVTKKESKRKHPFVTVFCYCLNQQHLGGNVAMDERNKKNKKINRYTFI